MKHKFAAGTNTYLEDKINDPTVQETPESISIDQYIYIYPCSSLTDEDDDFGGVDEIEIEKYIP